MRIIKWLDEHFEEYVMVYLLIILSSVMMLQVIMRYVFNSSLSWPEELTRYCFVWSTFIGVSYSIKRGLSLRIDVVYQFLPKKLQKIVLIIVRTIEFAFFAYILMIAKDVLINIAKSGQLSPAMRMPMEYLYLSIFVGSILALIRGLQGIISSFKELMN